MAYEMAAQLIFVLRNSFNLRQRMAYFSDVQVGSSSMIGRAVSRAI